MTDAESKRSEDETGADAVRRRLVETVSELLDEIRRQTPERHDVDTERGSSD